MTITTMMMTSTSITQHCFLSGKKTRKVSTFAYRSPGKYRPSDSFSARSTFRMTPFSLLSVRSMSLSRSSNILVKYSVVIHSNLRTRKSSSKTQHVSTISNNQMCPCVTSHTTLLQYSNTEYVQYHYSNHFPDSPHTTECQTLKFSVYI